jgi:hypothetical protein
LASRRRAASTCPSNQHAARSHFSSASRTGTTRAATSAEVAGDGPCLALVLAGLAAGPGPRGESAEAVQRIGLAEPLAEVTEQCQGLLLAGGGRRVFAGFLLHDAKAVESVGLAVQVAEVAVQLEGLLLAGGGRRVFAGQLLYQAQVDEGVGLDEAVAGAAY